MKSLSIFAAFLILAPGSAMAALPACPNIGLKQVPVTFVTAKGRFSYTIEVAATPEQQQCGLMYRDKMPKKVGMGFPFSPPRDLTFWMENTPLPLDLIFVGADSRVINVGKGVPYARDLIASKGPAARVIELNAGEAARIGLKPGDSVEP